MLSNKEEAGAMLYMKDEVYEMVRNIQEFEKLIEEYMGGDSAEYLSEYLEDQEYEVPEGKLNDLKDHYEYFFFEIQRETGKLIQLLSERDLDRKKIREKVNLINLICTEAK